MTHRPARACLEGRRRLACNKSGVFASCSKALAVMEAMKMEHTIAAPADGTVAELLFAPGDQVTEGAELLKLALAE